MRHQQATVLDIITQAAREIDCDQSEVANGIFDSSSSTQSMWQGRLKSAIEWLLTLQINKTAFEPLIVATNLLADNSTFYEQEANRTVEYLSELSIGNDPNKSPHTLTAIRTVLPNNTVYNRTLIAPLQNAFNLPEDYWDMLKIHPRCDYKILYNQLYVKDSGVKSITIVYISCYAFISRDVLGNPVKTRDAKLDTDICLLDKELVVKAIKYMFAKETADTTLAIKEQDAINRATYFLGRDSDFTFSNSIRFGR